MPVIILEYFIQNIQQFHRSIMNNQFVLWEIGVLLMIHGPLRHVCSPVFHMRASHCFPLMAVSPTAPAILSLKLTCGSA